MELDPIVRSDFWILDVVLFICFALLALSKYIDRQLFVVLGHYFNDWSHSAELKNKELRLHPTSILFMILFCLLSICVCSTLGLHYYIHHGIDVGFSYEHGFSIALACIVVVFMYHFTCLLLVGLLSGEMLLFRKLAHHLLSNMLWWGPIIFLIAVCWLFHLLQPSTLYTVFIVVCITFACIVISKVIVTCFRHKVSLYYIILYLCTLELLPMLLLRTFLSVE